MLAIYQLSLPNTSTYPLLVHMLNLPLTAAGFSPHMTFPAGYSLIDIFTAHTYAKSPLTPARFLLPYDIPCQISSIILPESYSLPKIYKPIAGYGGHILPCNHSHLIILFTLYFFIILHYISPYYNYSGIQVILWTHMIWYTVYILWIIWYDTLWHHYVLIMHKAM